MSAITEQSVLCALRHVVDPELGVNVVDLGLVYSIDVREVHIDVKMTMTTRTCPLAAYLKETAEGAIRRELPDAGDVRIEMVWDPPWQPAMMSPAAKRHLGWK